MRARGWRRCRRRSGSRWLSGRPSWTGAQGCAKIAKNVEDMSELINKLDREVAARTGLGAYEKKSRASSRVPRRPRDAPQRPCLRQVQPPLHAVARAHQARHALRRDQGAAAVAGPGPPRVWCSATRRSTARCQRASACRRATAGRWCHRATAGSCTPVSSAAYGQLLIINGGSGYHILLAGLSQIDVQFGQFVLIGEAVGVMGEAIKSSQAKDSGQRPRSCTSNFGKTDGR